MNRIELLKLAARIERDDANVTVTNTGRIYAGSDKPRSGYLVCVDDWTGIPFNVRSLEEWEDRIKVAKLYS